MTGSWQAGLGLSRLGRSSRNQRVPAPHSRTKGRCLGSARPDGAGRSPETAREAITAGGEEVRRHQQTPYASRGSPLAPIPRQVRQSGGRGYAATGGVASSPRWERGRRHMRAHSRRPRAADSVPGWRRRLLEAGRPGRRRDPVGRQRPRIPKPLRMRPGLVSRGCLWRE